MTPLFVADPPNAVSVPPAIDVPIELNGFAAAPILCAAEVVGVLVHQQASTELVTLACGLLGGLVRAARDERELQRLREERFEELIRSETLAATGMLSAGVAHELNNPLGVVLGLAELMLLDDDVTESVRADLGVIVEETSRAVRVVKQLLSYGRGGGLELERVALDELVESVAAILEATMGQPAIQVARALPSESYAAMADPFRLQQALLAILDNARHALRGANGDGRIEVGLRPVGNDRVAITCRDNGPGVPEDVMPRIFDPFFTTREVGTGTGMGLALVQRTVQDLGGELECRNHPEGGAEFVLILDRLIDSA